MLSVGSHTGSVAEHQILQAQFRLIITLNRALMTYLMSYGLEIHEPRRFVETRYRLSTTEHLVANDSLSNDSPCLIP